MIEKNSNQRNNLKEKINKKNKYLAKNLYTEMLNNFEKKEEVIKNDSKNNSVELNKKLKRSRSLL